MKSMTGFGRASLESNGKNYIIEIKTVNNKYSDITVKSPKRLSFIEDKIRKQIANKITRGKVEVSVSFFDFSNKSKNVVLKMWIGVNQNNIRRYSIVFPSHATRGCR